MLIILVRILEMPKGGEATVRKRGITSLQLPGRAEDNEVSAVKISGKFGSSAAHTGMANAHMRLELRLEVANGYRSPSQRAQVLLR